MTDAAQTKNALRDTRNTSVLRIFAQMLTALFLSVSLIGSGLFMCCTPFATEGLSKLFSQWQGSPFTHAELTEAALATRDYTVGTHDREAIINTLYALNKSSQEEGRSTLRGAPPLPEAGESTTTDDLAARFMLADDTYVLTPDALTHLDDVFYVVEGARIALIVMAAFALIGCVILGATSGKRTLGKTLRLASMLVIVIFATLAAWVIVDFSGFFAFLHSLFFAEGTWMFSADSLLIRMYPTPFWVGMGVVWLFTTVLASVICFILGTALKGRKQKVLHE